VNPLDQQRQDWPGAVATRLASGATLIIVPEISLPSGWSVPKTNVRFIAPNGYPFASPDCFWADPALRLLNLALPQSSAVNAIPETPETGLWFSWHAQAWNPSRDSLRTYLKVVMNRLRTAV
jgi:hypothetical protein